MRPQDVTVVVLCGGAGSRLGVPDKTLVPVLGRPLVSYTLDGLAQQVGRVVLSCGRDPQSYAALGHTVVTDAEPGEGPDHPVGIIEGFGDEVPMYNLINMEKKPETFSFVFDGNTQLLDHMLVSPSLLNHVQAADILHFNVSYPAVMHGVDGTAVRAADHDPVEGRFKFR